jgi:uncharacterized protein (DUF885 family)
MSCVLRVVVLAALLGTTLDPICARASEPPSAAVADEEEALEALYAAYWQDWLALNPQEALVQGVTRYEAQFDDSLEDSWQRDLVSMLKRYQAALMRFDPAPLPEEARLSYEMLHYELAQALSYYGTGLYETARMLPINQFMGQHTAFALDQSGSG